jgi:hypothetical protein
VDRAASSRSARQRPTSSRNSTSAHKNSPPRSDILKSLPQPFTVAEFKRALNTTRRVVIPLLEQLDAQRMTLRGADGTRTVVDSGRLGRDHA